MFVAFESKPPPIPIVKGWSVPVVAPPSPFPTLSVTKKSFRTPPPASSHPKTGDAPPPHYLRTTDSRTEGPKQNIKPNFAIDCKNVKSTIFRKCGNIFLPHFLPYNRRFSNKFLSERKWGGGAAPILGEEIGEGGGCPTPTPKNKSSRKSRCRSSSVSGAGREQ